MITEILGQRGLQRAFLASAFSACFFFISCGGGGSSRRTVIVSKVANRVFVSNQQINALQVVDAQKDEVTTFNVGTGLGPAALFEVQSKKFTVVYNSAERSLATIDNAVEQQSGAVALPDSAVS